MSVLTTARIGFTINDAFTAAYSNLAGRFNNISANYWTPENQSGTEPRPSVSGLGNFASARNYKDGSFVRIRDITLGYTLSRQAGEPLRRRRRARLYVRAQDPFIFTYLQGMGSGSRLQRRQRRTAARRRSIRAVRLSARCSSASTSGSDSATAHAYGIPHEAYTIGPRTRRPRGGGRLHGPQGVPDHWRRPRATSKPPAGAERRDRRHLLGSPRLLRR